MILEDPSRTHVSSAAAVADLYESTNQPLVQPTGRTAQAAQASVLAVDEGGALRVLVVLTFVATQENVIYSSTELVADNEIGAAIEEALLFAESMGFILDGTGWPQMEVSQREELASRLPVFRPPQAKEKAKVVDRKAPVDPLAQLARLFAAFSLGAAALSFAACGGMSAEQKQKSAEINCDLGTNSLSHGDTQAALTSYLQCEKDDPDLPQVHNALGLIYGFSLGKPAEAESEFKHGLALGEDSKELDLPIFSELDNNYGAFLLSRERYTEAIPHFEHAVANPNYAQRTTAKCNLGWALYKTGAYDRAVNQLRAALLVEPRFCKGWRQLGTIFSEKGLLDDAHDAYDHYAEACPETADAQLQLAKILVREAKGLDARKALEKCVALGHTADPATASACNKELRGMGAP